MNRIRVRNYTPSIQLLHLILNSKNGRSSKTGGNMPKHSRIRSFEGQNLVHRDVDVYKFGNVLPRRSITFWQELLNIGTQLRQVWHLPIAGTSSSGKIYLADFQLVLPTLRALGVVLQSPRYGIKLQLY